MKLLLITLFLITSLFSQVYDLNKDFTQKESSVFDNTPSNINEDIIKEEKNSINEESVTIYEKPTFREQNLYLSYKYFPNKIFKNQRFKIVLKLIITTENYDSIQTNFIGGKNLDVLNEESQWILEEDQTFENSFYFKVYDESFKLPTFEISIIKNGVVVETQKIKTQNVSFSEIGKSVENFSSVIAKDLIINAHKTKQYNNDELITIFDLSAVESNLEDFKIKNIKEQGISKIEDNYPEQNLLYYLILPVHTKNFDFSYYNTDQKRFITIKVPIILENELVSTQTDLNPNKSNLLLYKKIGIGGLVAIFVLLFIIKRKKIFIIAALISLAVLLVYVIPNKNAVLKKDSYIYILPTKKSTIFQKTDKSIIVEVSIKRGEFIKIIFNQGDKSLIGWVKENDLIEN